MTQRLAEENLCLFCSCAGACLAVAAAREHYLHLFNAADVLQLLGTVRHNRVFCLICLREHNTPQFPSAHLYMHLQICRGLQYCCTAATLYTEGLQLDGHRGARKAQVGSRSSPRSPGSTALSRHAYRSCAGGRMARCSDFGCEMHRPHGMPCHQHISHDLDIICRDS